MVFDLKKFADAFKSEIAKEQTAPLAPAANLPAAISQADGHADGPEVDAQGYAVQEKAEGGAVPDGVVLPVFQKTEYTGIGNANGVIPGESRTRLE